MQNSDTYVRSTSVVARTIGGETLIVPVCGGVGDLASIYSLNEVGTLAWTALEGPIELSALADLIASEFEVTHEQAQRDTARFLSELEAVGLAGQAKV